MVKDALVSPDFADYSLLPKDALVERIRRVRASLGPRC